MRGPLQWVEILFEEAFRFLQYAHAFSRVFPLNFYTAIIIIAYMNGS